MTRDDERFQRASQPPIVGGLPDIPGIGAAMGLSPGLGVHLRGLADALLVDDFPGATLRRAEREMIAAATSAGNDCFFCMDSHAAFATELLDRDGDVAAKPLVDELLVGAIDGFDPKMRALLHIASVVRRNPLELTMDDVTSATGAGATDGDVQLAVCIASAFSMYNRLVDGLRTMSPPSGSPTRATAARPTEHGLPEQAVTLTLSLRRRDGGAPTLLRHLGTVGSSWSEDRPRSAFPPTQ
jgi:uncharacterized peroxidase-related enzyme